MSIFSPFDGYWRRRRCGYWGRGYWRRRYWRRGWFY